MSELVPSSSAAHIIGPLCLQGFLASRFQSLCVSLLKVQSEPNARSPYPACYYGRGKLYSLGEVSKKLMYISVGCLAVLGPIPVLLQA